MSTVRTVMCLPAPEFDASAQDFEQHNLERCARVHSFLKGRIVDLATE